ncbi:MAG TPA: FHA domain-containing protein [Anaerolineae bacterium]|nr:FHA domain-containing protein [Anaerolineae bacterium]
MDWLLLLRVLLALCLYAFLGLAFYGLWQGLRQNTRGAAAPHVHARLVCEQGLEAGRVVELYVISTVGRAANNTVVIADAFASAHHAMLQWRERAWWLEDLESHNGTYLNTECIAQPALLTSGDVIRIGETILRFEQNLPEQTGTQ